jgi:hypothetical protein
VTACIPRAAGIAVVRFTGVGKLSGQKSCASSPGFVREGVHLAFLQRNQGTKRTFLSDLDCHFLIFLRSTSTGFAATGSIWIFLRQDLDRKGTELREDAGTSRKYTVTILRSEELRSVAGLNEFTETDDKYAL